MSAWFHRLFRPHPQSLLGQLRSPLYLRWQAGVQLFSLVTLFQRPLEHGFSWHWLGPTLLSVPLFLLFYIRLYIAPVRQMLAHALALAALGHTLSLVALKSELARKLALRDPPAAQREMEEVERVARHALGEVRAAVTGMRRSDLAAELLSARLMLEASGIVFACDGCESLDLPHAIEAPLALVLREAVTNIHRHARATEARIDISNAQGELRMRISDNGCGGLAAHGNGVSGMRERVRALGGTLAIDSPPRRGTALELRVPLTAAAAVVPLHAVESAA